MKIFYVITKSEIGGAQTHLSQLVDFFSAKGNEIYVMSHPGGWLENEVKGKAVFLPNIYFSNSFNPFLAFKAILEIKAAIKVCKPDLIHCHSSAAAAFARLAVKNCLPIVYTAHGWAFNIGTSFAQKYIAIAIEKVLSRNTKIIICVSDFVKNLALKYKIASEDEMVVVHNGVKVDELKEKFENETIKIATVGRLAEPKCPEILVEALVRCDENIRNKIRLIVFGSGPKRKEIEKRLAGLSVDIREVSPSELKIHLRNSDLFVLISKWEGFPYSVIEAMEAGLPIIASDVGGISEAVVDGKNGFLVNNNAEDISKKLTILLSNFELRKKMGEESRKILEEKFSVQSMILKIQKIYEKINIL